MPPPVSAIEAIEKAMEGLRNATGPWEVESEKQDDLSPKHDEFALHNADGYRMCGTENADWRFSEIVTDGPDEDGFFSDWNDPAERLMKYIAACNPVAIREVLDELYMLRKAVGKDAREFMQSLVDDASRYNALRKEAARQAEALQRRAEDAEALVERLKLEAQARAMEARGANSTINEIYQAASGGKGERGNWHGAAPVREKLEALQRENAELRRMLERCAPAERSKSWLPVPLWNDARALLGGSENAE